MLTFGVYQVAIAPVTTVPSVDENPPFGLKLTQNLLRAALRHAGFFSNGFYRRPALANIIRVIGKSQHHQERALLARPFIPYPRHYADAHAAPTEAATGRTVTRQGVCASTQRNEDARITRLLSSSITPALTSVSKTHFSRLSPSRAL